jgi:hypothetical protein
MYFGILFLEQVVNVAISKRRFQIQLGLAVNRLAMNYVAWSGRSPIKKVHAQAKKNQRV